MTKDDLFNRTARLISRIHDFEAKLTEQGGDEHVTAQQFDVLKILYFTSQKNLSELSKCMNINLPNSSREVKKLTQLGYIQKSSSIEDKRKTELSLTTEGRTKVEKFLEKMKDDFYAQGGVWTVERIERCIKSIDVLEEELFLF